MSHRKLLLTAVLGISSALVIAACGGRSSPSKSGSGGSSLTGLSPKAALVKAASSAASQAGAKLQITANVTSSEGHFTITGTGEFNKSPEAFAAQIDASGVPVLGSESLEVVVAKGVVYIKIPTNLPATESAELGALLHGKSWVALDPKSLSHLGSGLGALAAGSSSFKSAELLKVLNSATNISKVGSATVDGVATTEYRATIDAAKLPDATAASKELPSAVPVTFWIDGSGLLRRLSVSTSSVAGSSFAATVEVPSYGPQTTPAIPSASETFNLTPLLRGLSGGNIPLSGL
jgi:hypothetical protein